jgi:hypothetical protein
MDFMGFLQKGGAKDRGRAPALQETLWRSLRDMRFVAKRASPPKAHASAGPIGLAKHYLQWRKTNLSILPPSF